MADIGRTPEHYGEKIIIVEDSPGQAERLRYLLEEQNYQVVVAGNGSAALAMINTENPALIISDIVMPEMDGYELCRRIKSHDEQCGIRIILLTSLSDPEDIIRGLECGADNFITKPYDEELLISRIGYLLKNRYEADDCAALPGINIIFAGKEFTITSGRHQILDLLLSTYEAAIHKNSELIKTRDELNELNGQLKALNQDLEAFSHTVSHDLRGPLNNIFGSCQVIQELYGNKFDETCLEFFKYIHDSAKNMDKLISTILKFSFLSSKELSREEVNLSRLAHEIAAEQRFSEAQRQVTFRIEDGIITSGDTHLLRIVMENLLANAWKYTRMKEAAVIEFGMFEQNGKPVYFVRDNGAGFDMAYADRLFSPFQRLHAASEFEGFGIGLSTAQRIIKRHNGSIWAEGEPGAGASFYFTLNP